MRSVKVSKSDLAEALKNNREKHVAEFDQAWEGYRKKCVEQLERNLVAARDKKPFQIYLNLEQPVNHSEDYDRALQMLEWELEDTVELTEQEFAQFIQDEWGWKNKFTTTNASYTS